MGNHKYVGFPLAHSFNLYAHDRSMAFCVLHHFSRATVNNPTNNEF